MDLSHSHEALPPDWSQMNLVRLVRMKMLNFTGDGSDVRFSVKQ